MIFQTVLVKYDHVPVVLFRRIPFVRRSFFAIHWLHFQTVPVPNNPDDSSREDQIFPTQLYTLFVIAFHFPKLDAKLNRHLCKEIRCKE